MLQNNPLKSDIEQMNDWEAFKEHIQHSVDKQVVSNKTVIMILFIAQQTNANAQLIREGFAAINQQKITDQANEIQALRTQAIVNAVGCQTNNQLSQVNNTLNSIVTGCGVKSYPSCGCGCN